MACVLRDQGSLRALEAAPPSQGVPITKEAHRVESAGFLRGYKPRGPWERSAIANEDTAPWLRKMPRRATVRAILFRNQGWKLVSGQRRMVAFRTHLISCQSQRRHLL